MTKIHKNLLTQLTVDSDINIENDLNQQLIVSKLKNIFVKKYEVYNDDNRKRCQRYSENMVLTQKNIKVPKLSDGLSAPSQPNIIFTSPQLRKKNTLIINPETAENLWDVLQRTFSEQSKLNVIKESNVDDKQFTILKWKAEYPDCRFNIKDMTKFYDITTQLCCFHNEFSILVTIRSISQEVQMKRDEKFTTYKQKLIQSLTHNLKTPLNSIVMPLEYICLHYKEPDFSINEIYNRIDHQLKILVYQIDDLIDFSLIDHEDLILTIEQFNLVQTINEVVDLLREKAEVKNLKLLLDY